MVKSAAAPSPWSFYLFELQQFLCKEAYAPRGHGMHTFRAADLVDLDHVAIEKMGPKKSDVEAKKIRLQAFSLQQCGLKPYTKDVLAKMKRVLQSPQNREAQGMMDLFFEMKIAGYEMAIEGKAEISKRKKDLEKWRLALLKRAFPNEITLQNLKVMPSIKKLKSLPHLSEEARQFIQNSLHFKVKKEAELFSSSGLYNISEMLILDEAQKMPATSPAEKEVQNDFMTLYLCLNTAYQLYKNNLKALGSHKEAATSPELLLALDTAYELFQKLKPEATPLSQEQQERKKHDFNARFITAAKNHKDGRYPLSARLWFRVLVSATVGVLSLGIYPLVQLVRTAIKRRKDSKIAPELTSEMPLDLSANGALAAKERYEKENLSLLPHFRVIYERDLHLQAITKTKRNEIYLPKPKP